MLRRTFFTLLGAIFLVGVSAGYASASELFESELAGKQVANQEIAGISPDVAQPWVVAQGDFSFSMGRSVRFDRSSRASCVRRPAV